MTFPIELSGGRRLWPDPEAGTYQISDGGGWLPGIYADEDTARRAFEVGFDELQTLSDRICRIDGENRAITVADLEGIRT